PDLRRGLGLARDPFVLGGADAADADAGADRDDARAERGAHLGDVHDGFGLQGFEGVQHEWDSLVRGSWRWWFGRFDPARGGARPALGWTSVRDEAKPGRR